jgi:hypothetical protein
MRKSMRWMFAMSVILGSVMAGPAAAQIDVGLAIGFPLAPGQTGMSPGQVFNAAKTADPTTALPPGKLFIQNRAADPTTAVAPGRTFTNYGRSKK